MVKKWNLSHKSSSWFWNCCWYNNSKAVVSRDVAIGSHLDVSELNFELGLQQDECITTHHCLLEPNKQPEVPQSNNNESKYSQDDTPTSVIRTTNKLQLCGFDCGGCTPQESESTGYLTSRTEAVHSSVPTFLERSCSSPLADHRRHIDDIRSLQSEDQTLLMPISPLQMRLQIDYLQSAFLPFHPTSAYILLPT